MVSDSDLVTRLRQILRSSNLDTATAATVRKQLEDDFNLDLSDRKAFFRDQIDIFLQTFDKDLESDNRNYAVEQHEEEEEEESDSRIAESKNVDKEVKKRGGGFNKLCSLSPELQKLCGVPELARTEVVKKMWAYIRENSLQDPKNKRKIICDESLQALFHVKSIDMFKMNIALTKHIWPLSAENENVKQKISHDSVSGDTNKLKEEGKGEREEEVEEDEQEEEEEENKNELGIQEKRSTKVDKAVKKRGGRFTKLCSLSPQLQALIGVSELARTEVVKKLWIYIRENNLQDPKDKRNIICDESLHALFGVNSINMFKMTKDLSGHIWPLDEEDVPAKSTLKRKRSKQVGEGADESNKKEKRQKKGSSNFRPPLPLSDALVKFFGTGENAMSRADVYKKMWDYIKQNDLQDPSDMRMIICDDKLKELFEVDSFPGFSIPKLLTGHFVKISTKVDKAVKKRGGRFTKLCSLSPQLQALIGVSELARTEVVKKLWIYIRENNLQDPKDKRNIICDESLHALFGVNSINMFKMTKDLSGHIWPLDEEDVPAKSTLKGKRSKQVGEGAEESNKKEKRQKKGSSNFRPPLPLSDALVKFFGTGENAMSRADVYKRMWDYIKQNDLQDPSGMRMIICDDKLKELFEVDSFRGFSIPKLLTGHFVKM